MKRFSEVYCWDEGVGVFNGLRGVIKVYKTLFIRTVTISLLDNMIISRLRSERVRHTYITHRTTQDVQRETRVNSVRPVGALFKFDIFFLL